MNGNSENRKEKGKRDIQRKRTDVGIREIFVRKGNGKLEGNNTVSYHYAHDKIPVPLVNLLY